MSHTATHALGWTLIHFVWQGAAIALAAGAGSAMLRGARPAARYALFCAALALMAAAPVATYVLLRSGPVDAIPFPTGLEVHARAIALAPAPDAMPAGSAPFGWIPTLVFGWMCGLVLLAVRQVGGFALAMRLARWKTSPAPEPLQRAAAALCARLGIRRGVRILQSAAAEIPSAIGWIKPVVLLPVSAVTALTPQQLELLLAHELAHVKRLDYLVNLLQAAVETVLYYHPAVWWVSANVRSEREHCCDDLAVAACGDAVGYARTLATLEGLRSGPSLAVSAGGGSLLRRIRRLTGRHDGERHAAPAWLGALIPAAAILAAVVTVPPPPAVAESAPPSQGFLGGLTAIGYTKIDVDDIIRLREHGVTPSYIGAMMAVGLGTPTVEQVIRLHEHGVRSDTLANVVKSGLVSDLSFELAVRLRDHGAPEPELLGVRALGFGPYSTDDVIRLTQHGVGLDTFQAFLEAGVTRATADEAIVFRDNDVTAARIRSMKAQGFANLNYEQIVKLRRAGVI